ncbi:hypothetical protein L596_025629 [Steinernema carpocapsae]|uniref:Uncharacterized protein n=1 Tax=Steinernema carpocapsae TaxID=34508 RepID=A0A4U5M8C9_STECR|nr:hypothetical protein L596_025629 [Steinernema carpocapsae]
MKSPYSIFLHHGLGLRGTPSLLSTSRCHQNQNFNKLYHFSLIPELLLARQSSSDRFWRPMPWDKAQNCVGALFVHFKDCYATQEDFEEVFKREYEEEYERIMT